MKQLILILLFVCSNAFAALTDIKFGQYQIADSQWNVSACLYTSTCQIYSKAPGVAYQIPWYNGQLNWGAGDYVKFSLTGNATNPYNAIQYTANGTQKAVMGTGHIINMGPDFFFFVGNDNNTGQLFSGTTGMSDTSGITWTGTLNPTTAQADTYSTSYSTTPLAAGATATTSGTATAPTLCCGGSSAPFNMDATNVAKLNTFINRTTADTKVFIEQIGNQNTITVDQTGTKNNYVNYYSNGNNNATTVTQSSTNSSATNYTDIRILGNRNTSTIQQTSSGGTKSAFVTINDSDNTLLLQQKDSGSHHADILLSGGNKNVDILQQGSGNHMTKISLSGSPTDLSLSQTGSTQQSYSIQFNCATTSGCQKITVTQGQ